jgi:hypothetical protein
MDSVAVVSASGDSLARRASSRADEESASLDLVSLSPASSFPSGMGGVGGVQPTFFVLGDGDDIVLVAQGV